MMYFNTVVRKTLMGYIEVSLLVESDKDLVLSNGIMGKSLKDNGRKAQRMGSAYGSHRKEIFTKDTG